MTAPGGGDAAATLRGMEAGGHPHIDNDDVMANIDAIMEPRGFDKEADKALFEHLKDRGVINEDGKIDFTKLGLSPRQIKRAGLEGKVFIKENGQLDFNIRGKCGENAVKALEGFKKAIDDFIAKESDLGSKITLQINPSNVAKPSASDLEVLRRGGQIQYRPGDTHTEKDVTLQNTVKLTLDPGEKGGGDGLTVEVLNADGDRVHSTPKIPLDVVFGGEKLAGHRALNGNQPILPNWRERKLFEQAQVHVKIGGDDPKSNVNDPNRIQAENNLWSGVMDYLKVTTQATVGAFNAGGVEAPAVQPPAVKDADAAAAAARVDRDGQLDALYGELNAYLAKPKDVTTDGLGQFIQRLNDLKPQEGTPERNLLRHLNQLKQFIADPVTKPLPDISKIPPALSGSLSNIRNGLFELKMVVGMQGASPEGLYQAIKGANADNTNPIGQHCPTTAVNAVLTGLRQEVVDEVMTNIHNMEPITWSNVDNINLCSTMLAQVELMRGSEESNRVGQALLDKLTADPDGPWMAMAADPAQRDALQQQVAAFQAHFSNAVPDGVTNALAPAAAAPAAAAVPPPPLAAAAPAAAAPQPPPNVRERVGRLIRQILSFVRPAVITVDSARAWLEQMKQHYLEIAALVDTLGNATQARQFKERAGFALKFVIRDLYVLIPGFQHLKSHQIVIDTDPDRFIGSLQRLIDDIDNLPPALP
jgi:hypothetical protein